MAGEFFKTTEKEGVSNIYNPTEKFVMVQMQNLEGAIVKVQGRLHASAQFDDIWTSSNFVGRPVPLLSFPEMRFEVLANKPGNEVQIWVSG